MPSDGSADLRFPTRLSLPHARAASCIAPCTIKHGLGGPPCPSLARFTSVWRSATTPSPSPLSPQPTTRQAASAQRVRQLPSQAQHLAFVYEAGPRGSWLCRSLTQKVAASIQRPSSAANESIRASVKRLQSLARSSAATTVGLPATELVDRLDCCHDEHVTGRMLSIMAILMQPCAKSALDVLDNPMHFADGV